MSNTRKQEESGIELVDLRHFRLTRENAPSDTRLMCFRRSSNAMQQGRFERYLNNMRLEFAIRQERFGRLLKGLNVRREFFRKPIKRYEDKKSDHDSPIIDAIWLVIYMQLDTRSLANLMLTSKKFCNLANHGKIRERLYADNALVENRKRFSIFCKKPNPALLPSLALESSAVRNSVNPLAKEEISLQEDKVLMQPGPFGFILKRG